VAIQNDELGEYWWVKSGTNPVTILRRVGRRREKAEIVKEMLDEELATASRDRDATS
jgi:hypothetical protein